MNPSCWTGSWTIGSGQALSGGLLANSACGIAGGPCRQDSGAQEEKLDKKPLEPLTVVSMILPV